MTKKDVGLHFALFQKIIIFFFSFRKTVFWGHLSGSVG